MGNNPSTSQKQSAGQSPHIGSHSNHDRHDRHEKHERTQGVTDKGQRGDGGTTGHEPKRRESIHALSHPKAPLAPPSASLASAVAQPVTAAASTSPSSARTSIPKSSHSRNRSATIATPQLHPQDSPGRAMGNEGSKQSRERSTSRGTRTAVSPPEIKTSSVSSPVSVPGARDGPAAFEPSPLDPTAPGSEAYALPPASYSRPPRLPLPIEEEVHTPGSPILSPTGDEITSPVDVDVNEIEQEENRRGSIVSSNIDDEEERDEFQGYMPEGGANVTKVPTIIEWREAKPNDKVYVTGTFTDWQRKYRLHQNGPSKHPDAVSATLQLPPGTHHVKFLVNNDMVCSTFLPTTVDFTNILVNYIEVSAKPAKSAPVAVPPPQPSKPMDIRPKQVESAMSPMRGVSPSTKAPFTPSPSATPVRASPRPAPTPPPTSAARQDTEARSSPSTKPKTPIPPKQYTSEIPAYLVDLDMYPPPSEAPENIDTNLNSAASRYQRATLATSSLPPAPSLPLFLSKSILNGATPLKDDSSVLIMPNHTVLNHLATTNIKAGVLATSATTRYKQKYLTTIMYKPRSEDGD